jgi:transcriptional regulatory protein LevR
MNREDMIRMAREAGFCHDINNGIYLCAPMHIEQFVALVAAAEKKKWQDQTVVDIHEAVLEEREACAKVCDDIDAEYEGEDVLATWCAAAIRARGQA